MGLLFVVPGITWGPVLAPARLEPLAAAGRAAGASLLVGAVVCTVLASVRLLAPIPIVVALVGVTALPPLVHLVRTRRAPGRPRRRPSRRRWITAVVALAGLIVIAVLVVVPSRAAVGEAMLPFGSTVWYYANLARETAAAGGLPASLPEWGSMRPFHPDYLPVTAHTAAAMALLPGVDLRVVLEVYRLAVLVEVALVAVLLARRYVSAWLAVAASVLLVATVRLEGKFLAYRPETWALGLALFTVWLADRAIVERSPRLWVAAAAAAAVTWAAHAEVFLLLGPALVGLAAARLMVGRGRVGLRLPGRRRVLPAVAVGAGVLVAGMLAGSALTFVVTGELRILGYVAGNDAATVVPAGPPADEAPPGWAPSGDPTWDFYVAAVAPGQQGVEPPSRFTDPRLMPRTIAWIWPGLDGRQPALRLMLLALLLVPLAAWPWLGPRQRRAVLGVAVFGVGLAAGSWLLFAISDTYVPMRTGPRRLLPYVLVLPVVAATVLLALVDRVLRPGWRALLGSRAAIGSWALVTVLLAAMIAPAPITPDVDELEPGLTPGGYAAYEWIAANLSPDARLLVNAYTDGAVAALAKRTGIVDGRAVYLEDPAFLAESTALLLGARSLFLDPDAAGPKRWLERVGATHLLVATGEATGADVGGYPLFATDVAGLDKSGDYTLLRTFDGGRLRLYAVDQQPAPGG